MEVKFQRENVVLQNYVNGKFVDASDNTWYDIYNPATGQIYGKMPDTPSKDIDDAVKSCKIAFETWKRTTREHRSKVLYKIADLIEQHAAEFAKAESFDQGKPVSLATNVDINRVCHNFRFFAGAILHTEESSTEIDNVAINFTQRRPLGVAGLLSPWNLPLYLLTWKLAPAMAVGNTCICKPSEFTSVTAWMMCKVFEAAGLPPGVVNMVFGTGPKTGAAIVKHPDVPLISFTGGTATAEHIIRDSAPHYKKLYLELGGKNPNIIFDDCDLEDCVATSVRSSFANQGEICLCGSRILVQDTIYEKFIEKFVAATQKIIVGDPEDPATVMGPLVSKQHWEKVTQMVEVAKKEGKLLCGGTVPTMPDKFKNGYWFNPTVVADLTPRCSTQQEEIFGPVVGIMKFKTEQEAIEMANSTRYGLSASVWTENVKRAHRVSSELDVGTVWVNCWMLRDLRVPFGGQKHSGLGRAGGAHSIDFYTEQRNVCVKYV